MDKKITTEADITGDVARELRAKLHLSQREFWGAVGVTQAAASRYETGKRTEDMAKPIRILVFTNYVARLKIDASTKDGVRQLRSLAKIQRGDRLELEPEAG